MKDYKKLYGIYLRSSILVSLILVIGAFVFIPTIEVKPYTKKIGTEFIVRDIFSPIDNPDRPEPPRPNRPQLPVADPDGNADSVVTTINQTVFIDSILLPDDPNAIEIVPYYSVQIKPQPIYTPAPEYPPLLLQAGIEGTCVLEAVIDTTGFILKVQIYHGSGNTLLDEAAVRAFKTYRFSPGIARDHPVFVRIRMPIAFAIR